MGSDGGGAAVQKGLTSLQEQNDSVPQFKIFFLCNGELSDVVDLSLSTLLCQRPHCKPGPLPSLSTPLSFSLPTPFELPPQQTLPRTVLSLRDEVSLRETRTVGYTDLQTGKRLVYVELFSHS